MRYREDEIPENPIVNTLNYADDCILDQAVGTWETNHVQQALGII